MLHPLQTIASAIAGNGASRASSHSALNHHPATQEDPVGNAVNILL